MSYVDAKKVTDALTELRKRPIMDYRELLLKYMRCCVKCDGLVHIPHDFMAEEFGLTKPEYDELVRLSAEVQP